jgi:hypothetical protein
LPTSVVEPYVAAADLCGVPNSTNGNGVPNSTSGNDEPSVAVAHLSGAPSVVEAAAADSSQATEDVGLFQHGSEEAEARLAGVDQSALPQRNLEEEPVKTHPVGVDQSALPPSNLAEEPAQAHPVGVDQSSSPPEIAEKVEAVVSERFRIGDRVRCRMAEGAYWLSGTVTSMNGEKVLAQPDGWPQAHSWDAIAAIQALPEESAMQPANHADPNNVIGEGGLFSRHVTGESSITRSEDPFSRHATDESFAIEDPSGANRAEEDVEMGMDGSSRELQEEARHGAGPPGDNGDSPSKKVEKSSRCSKIVRNPIFHVKAASWIIWGVCYFCVKGPEELTYMKVNHALQGVLPLLNNVMNHTLPRTLGDCSKSARAPMPCVGDGPVYVANESGLGQLEEQRVKARWVTGVNTVHLKDISLQVIPDSRKPIELGISGEVENLTMSIRIQQCLFGVGCKTLWDGTGGCCKPRRQFKLVIATDCADSTDGVATLGDFKVEWFNIDDIVLNENVLGFNQKLADLTPRVKKTVQKLTTNVFQGDTVFLNLTFAQVVSRLWRYNTAGGVRCSDFLSDSV